MNMIKIFTKLNYPFLFLNQTRRLTYKAVLQGWLIQAKNHNSKICEY